MFDYDCRKSDVIEIIEKLSNQEKEYCLEYCNNNPQNANKRICDSAIYQNALVSLLCKLKDL